MDREKMERCLEQVAAYQASGMKAKDWAQANGVPVRAIASWCAHARRWRTRLDGVAMPARKGEGFVAARLPVAVAATVRVEVQAGACRIELHWPVANGRELAAWLREVGR
jgi:hypothetical protein